VAAKVAVGKVVVLVAAWYDNDTTSTTARAEAEGRALSDASDEPFVRVTLQLSLQCLSMDVYQILARARLSA
jgi:hypothetical protein